MKLFLVFKLQVWSVGHTFQDYTITNIFVLRNAYLLKIFVFIFFDETLAEVPLRNDWNYSK